MINLLFFNLQTNKFCEVESPISTCNQNNIVIWRSFNNKKFWHGKSIYNLLNNKVITYHHDSFTSESDFDHNDLALTTTLSLVLQQHNNLLQDTSKNIDYIYFNNLVTNDHGFNGTLNSILTSTLRFRATYNTKEDFAAFDILTNNQALLKYLQSYLEFPAVCCMQTLSVLGKIKSNIALT